MFRPADAVEATKHIVLRGLDPDVEYRIVNQDTGAIQTGYGNVLLTEGLDVTIAEPRGSAVFLIERIY